MSSIATNLPPQRQDEANLVQRFLQDTRAPGWMEKAYRRWRQDREYLHTEVFAHEDDSRITVNNLLRSIYAKLGQVWPENPEAVVKPGDEVEPDELDPMRPMWEGRRRALEQIGKTAAVLCRKWTKTSFLTPTLRRAALATFTTGLCWLKTTWEEDTRRNALGVSQRHAGTARDQLIRLRRLSEEYARGDWGEEDGRHMELLDLSDWIRKEAQAKLRTLPMGDPREGRIAALLATEPGTPVDHWILPEPETWQAPAVHLVDPEDVRFDWLRVTGPSMCHLGRWWNTRIWMSREELSERFPGMTEDEVKAAGVMIARPNLNGNTVYGVYVPTPAQEDPTTADLEAQVRANGNEVAVWERIDLETGMIYWFVQGVPRFLAKDVYDLSPKRGHPFVPLCFYEVDGKFDPVSDVTFGKKPQEAFNQALTDDWEARIAAYPFYAIAHGMITDEDKRAIERGRRAHKVVELSRSAAEVRDSIQSIKGEEYHPERYQIAISQMQQLMERMVGAPTEATGGQGDAKFATQVAMMQNAMNTASGRIAKIITEAMAQVYEDWTDYALMTLPEKAAKALAGPAALWPAVDRESIRNSMMVEVITAGMRGQRKADLEDLAAAMGILGNAVALKAQAMQVGLDFDVKTVSSRTAAALDLRTTRGLLYQMQMAQPAMPGMPMPPGAPGLPVGAPAGPGQGVMPAPQAAMAAGGPIPPT